MKRLTIVMAGFAACVALAAQAASIAEDSAANYSGGSWTNGSNGGTGFGAWTLAGSGTAGFFLGDSTANAGGSGGINSTNGLSWGMWANSGGSADGYRPFTGSLSVGQHFLLALDNGWLNSGGPTVGIGLQNGAGNNLWEFYFAGGDANYTIHDNAGYNSSGIGFTGNGLFFDFQLTSASAYSVTVATGGGTNGYTGSLLANADQGVAQTHAWNFNAGTGANNDAYINSMAITIPEPGTVVLLGIGALGLLRFRRTRNQA